MMKSTTQHHTKFVYAQNSNTTIEYQHNQQWLLKSTNISILDIKNQGSSGGIELVFFAIVKNF